MFNLRVLFSLSLVVLFCILMQIPVVLAQTPAEEGEKQEEEQIALYILIDHSDSTDDTDPNDLRYAATRMIIDVADDSDKVGVACFASSVTETVPLEIVGSTEQRANKKNTINQNCKKGNTFMHLGLDKAISELTKTSASRKYIFLFTDGAPNIETIEGYTPTRALDSIKKAKNQQIDVIPIIILNNNDDLENFIEELPEQIRPYTVTDSNDLFDQFATIYSKIKPDRYVTIWEASDESEIRVSPLQQINQLVFVLPPNQGLIENEILLSCENNAACKMEGGYNLFTIERSPIEGSWRRTANATQAAIVIAQANFKPRLVYPPIADEVQTGYFFPRGVTQTLIAELEGASDSTVSILLNGNEGLLLPSGERTYMLKRFAKEQNAAEIKFDTDKALEISKNFALAPIPSPELGLPRLVASNPKLESATWENGHQFRLAVELSGTVDLIISPTVQALVLDNTKNELVFGPVGLDAQESESGLFRANELVTLTPGLEYRAIFWLDTVRVSDSVRYGDQLDISFSLPGEITVTGLLPSMTLEDFQKGSLPLTVDLTQRNSEVDLQAEFTLHNRPTNTDASTDFDIDVELERTTFEGFGNETTLSLTGPKDDICLPEGNYRGAITITSTSGLPISFVSPSGLPISPAGTEVTDKVGYGELKVLTEEVDLGSFCRLPGLLQNLCRGDEEYVTQTIQIEVPPCIKPTSIKAQPEGFIPGDMDAIGVQTPINDAQDLSTTTVEIQVIPTPNNLDPISLTVTGSSHSSNGNIIISREGQPHNLKVPVTYAKRSFWNTLEIWPRYEGPMRLGNLIIMSGISILVVFLLIALFVYYRLWLLRKRSNSDKVAVNPVNPVNPILDRIQQAKNRKELDLSGLGMTNLPPEIGQLTTLTKLDLSNNQLSELPPEIGQLISLTELDASNNQLSELPPEIWQLKKLVRLDLRDNPLPIRLEILRRTDEPHIIIKHALSAAQLIEQIYQGGATELDLSDKKLTELPSEIGQLINLTELDLSNNELSELPPEIGQLISLTELDASNNQLKSLPPEIWGLKKLVRFDLRNNPISNNFEIWRGTHEPDMIIKHALSAAELINQVMQEGATELDLSDKKLTDKELVELSLKSDKLADLTILDLSGNKLTKLPPEIHKLTKLEQLDMRGNPLRIPPEILARTYQPRTIIKYGQQKDQPLNEAKLVLLWPERQEDKETWRIEDVIQGISSNEAEGKTEQIRIKQGYVTLNDGTEIKLNIWDFADQKIMHATHQFFMTERTLYLLVLDSKGEREIVDKKLDYWLMRIRSFGQNSPILVVINQSDPKLFLNQRGWADKYGTIQGFIDISSKTNGENSEASENKINREINQLKEKTKSIIEKHTNTDNEDALLRHVRDLMPSQWLKIKGELEKREDDYISYHDYLELCQTNNIFDEKEQKDLIRLLHDLGVVLHFQDHPRLKHTIVLNYKWVIDGVNQILKQRQNEGVLNFEELSQILSGFSKEKLELILDIMRRFELGFDLEGQFLIPSLLPEGEPELNWPTDKSLNFEYHYDFLPPSVMGRFIVSMHRFTFEETYWRTGVVLVNNQNKAVVKAPPYDNRILISIIGEQKGRAEFGAMIHNQFKEIHNSIQGLNAEARVPLRDRKKLTVSYEHLRILKENSFTSFIPEGYEKEVNVEELLEGGISENAEQQKATRDLNNYLRYLRRRMHPEKYYSEILSLGKRHYEWEEYTIARQPLFAVHQAIQDLRGMVQHQRKQLELSKESANLYEMLVHCYLQEGRQTKAFEFAAIGKGRAFVKKLDDMNFDPSHFEENYPKFAKKLKEARQLHSQIEKLKNETNADQVELQSQLNSLFRKEINLWQEMADKNADLTAMLTAPIISAKEAHDLAKELDATLVEYYCHAGGWCAFVISKDAAEKEVVRYVPLPKLDSDLLERLIEWRDDVDLPAGRNPKRDNLLAELYEAAIADLGLIKGENVVIAPFGRLHLLPLSAAYNGQRYLVEDHVLSFIPTLTALHVVKQKGEPRPSSEKRIERLLSVAYPGPSDNYLPHVLDEGKAIVERVSKLAQVEFLHEEEAALDKVLKKIRKAPYDIIHFGCHGQFDAEKPAESGLMLAGGDLTVQRIISELDLKQTRLVTLAACLSGEVALYEGDEPIGLLQAMMTVGTQIVVGSLWSVDDIATYALFKAFYAIEVSINSPAQAMKETMALLRQEEEWNHPYYWAAFQVNGLSHPAKEIGAIQLEPDVEKQVKEDYQRRVRGGVSMSQRRQRRFVRNAESLLKQMLFDIPAEEVLVALEEHELPAEIAEQQVENGKLGSAQAIHDIVLNNPTLQKRLVPSVRDVEQLRQQLSRQRVSKGKHEDTGEPSRGMETARQGTNSVGEYDNVLKAILKAELPSHKPTRKQSLLEWFTNLLSRKR